MKHLQESFQSRVGWLALLLSVAALCFISGCDINNGFPGSVAPRYAGSGMLGPSEVRIQNSSFYLDTITVQAYTTVTWINMDPTCHTVTSDNGLFGSGNLDCNGTYEHTFATKGTFPYHCIYTANMHGTVIVR